MGIVYALVTVLAWGAWLAPSQHLPVKGGQQARIFYTTLGVLLLAIVVGFFKGFQGLTPKTSWLPFLGGIIWALSGLSAFVGTNRLGMAKAFGIWAPLNIVISIVWGIALFGEFLRTGTLNITLTVLSLIAIIGGILLIIFAGSERDTDEQGGAAFGYLAAFGAGIGFASYFIPIRISGVSMWVATVPLAAGMFVGAAAVTGVCKSSLRLEQPLHYMRIMSTGFLWGIGNYGVLLMMQRLGTGKGFTIAQLCVVVNALLGIYWEHKPRPGTRAAYRTLAGVAVATIGAVILGNLK